MKFLNIGLVALSSLFATTYAAPASNGLLPDLKVPEVPKVPSTEILDKRAQVVHTKVQYTIVEVRKHCSAINSTVDGASGGQVTEKKEDIIKLVKSEVTIIISLIHSLVGEVVELLGETVEIVGEEKEQIISLVLELVFEILYTLKNVIKVLGINELGIFELLGPLVFVLLTVVFHLLTSLNGLIEGLLKLVLSTLGGVIGLLLEVLNGLLPTVLGLVGGILNKLDLGGLLCSIL
ncbi:hypothetical protein ColLi_01641 [Colletotrichum liriopes]|uniref:Uncharacterized protein n=1 Tax=Colletotrichum liriopes TaxID=708192 RepID=A0AA37GE93_9PEZI|nr:hypothetical protein ColLi_01641 [Colletotrichum liriopes]